MRFIYTGSYKYQSQETKFYDVVDTSENTSIRDIIAEFKAQKGSTDYKVYAVKLPNDIIRLSTVAKVQYLIEDLDGRV